MAKTVNKIDKRFKTLNELKVEYIPINDVYPNKYNPNRQNEHEFNMLVSSIREDGFTQPVIVNQDNMIVDGEHRWKAAKAVGMTQIPVVRVDMNKEQMRISTIRHNKARGTHDVDLEANIYRELEQIGALDWAIDALQLDQVEVDALLSHETMDEAYKDKVLSEAWIPVSGETNVNVLRSESVRTSLSTVKEQIESARTVADKVSIRAEQKHKVVSLFVSQEEYDIIMNKFGEFAGNALVRCAMEHN
jgi:disulfide oxidoreductase YuzD